MIKTITSISTLLLLLSAQNISAQINPIDELKPGHWLEIPNTKVRSVAPSSVIDGVYIGRIETIMTNWSGGTYDTLRDRFLIHGGGHASYGGNEIYALDINSLVLSRIFGPSSFVGWKDGDLVMSDGAPVAAHSTDHIEYVPSIDKFCTFTNAANWAYNLKWDSTSFCYDFDTKKWSTIAPIPLGGNYLFSAYDPVSQHVFVHGGGSYTYLREYNPISNSWAARGSMWSDADFYFGATVTADIDSDRRLFVGIGGGRLYVWDISKPTGEIRGKVVTTTGNKEIEGTYAPGFAYDPNAGVFVAWNGGADVYILNPDDWSWSKKSPAPTNKVIPSSTANTFGTYGRFRYIPSKNAFIAVASVDENMFVYKLDSSTIFDTTPPSVPTGLNATVIEQNRIDISWNKSIDSESNVREYEIYRNSVHIGNSATTFFSDTKNLIPATQYQYQVVAVNNANLSSALSAPLLVSTLKDSNPPQLISVVADSATTIRLTFSEKVDPLTASNKSNYSLINGITVQEAFVEPDGITVTLKTTPHGLYLISTQGVKDISGNVMAPTDKNYKFP